MTKKYSQQANQSAVLSLVKAVFPDSDNSFQLNRKNSGTGFYTSYNLLLLGKKGENLKSQIATLEIKQRLRFQYGTLEKQRWNKI